jgi:hypothetical protein
MSSFRVSSSFKNKDDYSCSLSLQVNIEAAENIATIRKDAWTVSRSYMISMGRNHKTVNMVGLTRKMDGM